jgi:sigma-B regulation protein RsbU (phosphoserine phosphatase)
MASEEAAAFDREIYDGAPCGLLSTLANGTIVRANQTFCTWFGFSLEELVQKQRVQDLLTMGCRIFHQTHWLPLLQLQGSVAEVQLDFVHRDGRAIPVLVNALQRKVADTVTHEIAVFVAADRRKYEHELLNARRRAEELLERVRTAQEAAAVAETHLRLAIDAARLVVWDVDVSTHEVTYDASVHHLLGLSEPSELSSATFRERIHPADRAHEQAAFAAALSAGTAGAYFAEYRLLGADSVERFVASSGRAIVDTSGKLVRFSGVLRDVTVERKAQEALQAQERAARERAVLAEQLIGIVSHDLRTPLQAVSLGASLLGSSELAPPLLRTVNRISSATTRANRLIGDLLDFTQASLGGGLRLSLVECDLHAVVADVVDELKLAWPGRMLTHQNHGQGACLMDADRIAQVVTNLVGNALTYGRPELPVVVTTKNEANHCSLEVHNHGQPIPPELLPHLFEPLRRGEQQVKLGSRSVGLGLFIVQQIAVAHGGSVSVLSTAEEGTVFSVRLSAC